MHYDSLNQLVLDQVPKDARSLLDLGCGVGSMGAKLKSSLGCAVTGVTFDEGEAVVARDRLDKVVVEDLNKFDPSKLGTFDCVLCSHVLEHLIDPGAVLRRIHKCLPDHGNLVVGLPNILFWKQRLHFVRGKFRYTQGGLMDETHFRFFDWASAQDLLRDAGYAVREAVAEGGFPLSRFLWPVNSDALDRLAVRKFPGLLGWQFVFRCQPAATPGGAVKYAASGEPIPCQT